MILQSPVADLDFSTAVRSSGRNHTSPESSMVGFMNAPTATHIPTPLGQDVTGGLIFFLMQITQKSHLTVGTNGPSPRTYSITFIEVECPKEITDRSGCIRDSDSGLTPAASSGCRVRYQSSALSRIGGMLPKRRLRFQQTCVSILSFRKKSRGSCPILIRCIRETQQVWDGTYLFLNSHSTPAVQ